MDQLVVLQEIYESFSKGGEVLHSVDSGAIVGSCSDQVALLLDGAVGGSIDADVCLGLVDSLHDVYEMKRLGDICRKAGLLETAIRSYDRALSMTRDKGVKAVLLNNLGQVYAHYGDIGRAVTYYKKAAKAFQCAGDNSGLAHVQGNLGSAFRRGRDWDKAVDYCHRSQKAFEEQGDQLGAAQMTGSLGRVYAEMGDTSLAIRYFEKSLRDFQKLGDRRSEAWILYRLGRISAEGNNWDASIKHYAKSQSIFEEMGQEKSSAIVLSNLGRVYLDKGDATLARDCLERSLKALHKEMKPAYNNASSALAATYSILAKEHLDTSSVEQLRMASQYHSRAADRFMELASMPKIDLPDLSITASVARFLSALDELQAEQKDGEALILADRAIFALEDASASSSGTEKKQMEAIMRTLAGMKGIWSLSMQSKEPWKLGRSVADSIDYLMGGSNLSGEAGVCIRDALNALRGAIEDEQQRRSPFGQLKAAASSLRKADKRFSAEGTNSGSQSAVLLGKASELIEDLISAETGPMKAQPSNINELVNYRAHRNALLQIGWVLVRNSLPSIDKTGYVYTWDESMNLSEKRSPGEYSSAARVQITKAKDIMEMEEEDAIEEVIALPFIEPILEPMRKSPGWDGPIDEDVISDVGSGSCLVPVMAQIVYSPSNAKATVRHEKEIKASYRIDRFVPVVEVASSENRNQILVSEPNRFNLQEAAVDKEPPGVRERLKAPAQSEKRYAFGNGVLTQSNLINLMKAVAFVLAVLLAIDIILYLI